MNEMETPLPVIFFLFVDHILILLQHENLFKHKHRNIENSNYYPDTLNLHLVTFPSP